LRVISGVARGVHLHPVPGITTRPITDRVKESLFNIIGADIRGASFFDLFAGTGSVGIEALSRGATFVRFLDKDQRAIQTIRRNLDLTGLHHGGQVQAANAFDILKRPPERNFDYIYIAPPQYKQMWKRVLLDLENNPGWLAEDGWAIAQIHPVEYEDLVQNGELMSLREFDKRKYGSTLLVFYHIPVMKK
jgi:16S rRNA (guanine966-N2)-methyltransferase